VFVALYAGFFPRCNQLMVRHGFAMEAAEIAAAWTGGAARVRSVPSAMP